MAVEDIETCKNAAVTIQASVPGADFKRQISRTNKHDHPKGCFVYNGIISFNEHSTGSLNSMSQQVCRRGKEKKHFIRVLLD